jgi:hypothetical protein
LFHSDHGPGFGEGVVRIALSTVQRNAFVRIEATSEVVSVHDSEHAAVYVEVDSDVKVMPGIGLWLKTRDEDLVSLKEHALRDARVLYLVLKDVQGVVVQVVEDCALAHPVVLIRALDNGLLEVCFEVQDLFI